MDSSNDTGELLQAIANRLHSDVPIHVPARRHIRMWRPRRAGLFWTASMGLFDAPASDPSEHNGLHPDKARFLTEIRDFIDYLQHDEVNTLRENESQVRNGDAEAPFRGLHNQISQILSGGRRLSDAELPLRTIPEAGHSNAVFDIIKLAQYVPPVDSFTDRVIIRQTAAGNHRVLLFFSGNDLVAAYGRVNDDRGAHHEFFLRGVQHTGSPILSFANGLRSIQDHAEQFELLVVSLPSE